MRYIYAVLLLIFIISCSDSHKTIVTPKDYLNEVLKIVEEHSIRRDSVDFNVIKRDAYARLEECTRLKNTASIKDCYPIVKIILLDLGERHSFFMPKEEVEKWKSSNNTTDINEIITFNGKLLNQNIGYIHMKGYGNIDSIATQYYTDSLQNLIKSIDNENLKGWVIDLRENTGGNCWPMLAGLGPILGNGVCGYFIDNNQKRSSLFYKDGASGMDSLPGSKVSKQPYELFNNLNPVAILTGIQTLSTGEIVVTAFHNKKNARSFGESTGGFSSGNAIYNLSDGSMLVLTEALCVDREGNIFGKRIEPDEKIRFSYQTIGQPNDPVIEKAINWIYEY